MGKIDNYIWNDGQFLRNDKIAKDIIEFLIPKMNAKDYEGLDMEPIYGEIWLKEMYDVLSNSFQKYWYRCKGSRAKYTNERPSFWAITEYTDPWSFMKNDRLGYAAFKKKLAELASHPGEAQKAFYADWKHLLFIDP